MQFTEQERKEFKALVFPHLEALHRVAIRLTRDQGEGEELVAETILKACENFRKLRDHARIKQWLLRILSNTFVSQRRVERRYQETQFEEETEDGDSFSLYDKLTQSFLLLWGNPEREVVNKLMEEDIQRAISKLPEEFRIAVVLCDVEGLRYREIGQILGIPMGTVRSCLARGRALLQKQLWHHARDAGFIVTRTDAVGVPAMAHKEEQCTCGSEVSK
jgi:RNA polymerase sigma-70 factor (ECF subfamily)